VQKLSDAGSVENETGGCDEVDVQLVEDAVRHIRTVVASTVYKGAVDVGEFVLERFFGGDVDRVTSRSTRKSASFRSLAERCGTQELPISKTWLHSAVGVALMRRALPEGAAFRLLPPSHQAILLAAREPVEIEKLAQRALAGKLSARELRRTVHVETPRRTRRASRSRHESAPVVEAMQAALALLERRQSWFTMACIEELSEESAAHALQVAKKVIAKLADVVDRLEARDDSPKSL
jgi:hypothetical protein